MAEQFSNIEQENHKKQAFKDFPKMSKSVKGLSIACIVIAIVFFISVFIGGFFLSAAKEAIDNNGGWDAVSTIIVNATSDSESTSQSLADVDVNEIYNALEEGESAEDIAKNLTSKDYLTNQYSQLLQELFSLFTVILIVIAICLVALTTLSSVIIAQIKKIDKVRLCKILAIIMIPLSVIALNIPIFVLSIIIAVKINVRKFKI